LKSGLQGLDTVFQAGAPFLHELQNADPEITKALDQLFTTLAAEEPELAGIFGDLVGVLPLFLEDLNGMLELSDPLLKKLDTFLGFKPVQGIMSELLVGLLAYKTLSGPIAMLTKFGTALRGAASAETALAAAEVRKKEADALPDRQGPSTGGGGGGWGLGLGGLGALGAKIFGDGTLEAALHRLPIAATLISTTPDVHNSGSYDIAGGSAHGGLTLFGTPPTTLTGQEALFKQYQGNPTALRELAARFPDAGKALGYGGSSLAALRQGALTNDLRLRSLLAKGRGDVNIQTGAITVHAAPGMDEQKLAQKIREELDNWISERQDRGP
jgi:hypothetical protein